MIKIPGWSGDRVLPATPEGRGKSALRRAGRRVTPGMGQPVGLGPQKQTASFLEVRVKRWCKRPPAFAVMRRPGNPRPEQGQAGTTPLAGNGSFPFSLRRSSG